MVTLTGVASGALNIGILVGVVLIVGGLVIATTVLLLKWKKFSQYECIIFEKDGFGQLKYKTDMAGIFVDSKTKNKRLFLKKNNVGLNPDNVPYLSGKKGLKTIYLYQTGLKNFHYIRMNVTDKFDITVGEEDVNWAINAYDRQKKLFNQSLLMQLMPFIALAFTSIIILIIFIYFFKDFAVLKDVAIALKEAAQANAQASSGTAIIP